MITVTAYNRMPPAGLYRGTKQEGDSNVAPVWVQHGKTLHYKSKAKTARHYARELSGASDVDTVVVIEHGSTASAYRAGILIARIDMPMFNHIRGYIANGWTHGDSSFRDNAEFWQVVHEQDLQLPPALLADIQNHAPLSIVEHMRQKKERIEQQLTTKPDDMP